MGKLETETQEFMRSIELLRSFSRMQKNLMRFVQRAALANGLSVPQYSILLSIGPEKEMTQKALREKTYLPKSTLSQAVDGLVQEGYIERQPVEGNRREMLLSLSMHGKDFLKAIHRQKDGLHEVFQTAAETLSEEQYEELLNMQHQIVTCLEEQADKLGL